MLAFFCWHLCADHEGAGWLLQARCCTSRQRRKARCGRSSPWSMGRFKKFGETDNCYVPRKGEVPSVSARLPCREVCPTLLSLAVWLVILHSSPWPPQASQEGVGGPQASLCGLQPRAWDECQCIVLSQAVPMGSLRWWAEPALPARPQPSYSLCPHRPPTGLPSSPPLPSLGGGRGLSA